MPIKPRPVYFETSTTMNLAQAAPQLYTYDIDAATALTVTTASTWQPTETLQFAGGTTTATQEFPSLGTVYPGDYPTNSVFYLKLGGSSDIQLNGEVPIGTKYQFIDMGNSDVLHTITIYTDQVSTINGQTGQFSFFGNYTKVTILKIASTHWLAVAKSS